MQAEGGMIAARRHAWEESLTQLQGKPLRYCPSFPEVARRWNAWWRFEADRPLMVVQTATKTDIRWDKGFDLLQDADAWLDLRRRQLTHTYCAGEALPAVRVDIGPVATAAFMGAPLHFAAAEQTSWQDPIIESWDRRPPLRVDPGNPWFRTVMSLLERLADDARGNYLVCLPDLTGALDVLANLRTTEKLCFDLHEAREQVLAAAAEAVDAWETAFGRMYDAVLRRGAGVTQWVACWANTPFTVPTCDFNALIGPDDFKGVCLPSLADQARRAGRCVFHLDGPDAARHAESLALAPEITAIQYTPGAGTPSALAKLSMFRRLQACRKPLFIECPVGEVRELLAALDPAGVAVRVQGVKTAEEADALVAWRDAAVTRANVFPAAPACLEKERRAPL